MMQRLLDLLTSLKLTLVLLFSLSLIAVIGTIWPSRDTELDVFRYELFYQTPWFRFLLGLLALNLTVCTLRLLSRRLRESGRLLEQLQSGALGGQKLKTTASGEAMAGRLGKLGYRTRHTGEIIFARKWWFGRYSVLVIHSSLLLIMLGAILSGLGFVRTLNILIGETSSVAFDWDAQGDRELGFSFKLDQFEPIFYPIELRFAAINPETGEVVSEYTVSNGDLVDLPTEGWQAKYVRFDPLAKGLHLKLYRQGDFVTDYQSVVGEKDPANLAAGLVLYPLAYRDPILKQYHSEVSIIEGGQVVRQGVIEVNQPLIHRGIAIYQTAFNLDPSGRVYAGFQFSKDPGEPLVWAGCILLMLGFVVNLGFRPRVAGLVGSQGGWRAVSLLGFRGESGRAEFQRLAEALDEEHSPGTSDAS